MRRWEWHFTRSECNEPRPEARAPRVHHFWIARQSDSVVYLICGRVLTLSPNPAETALFFEGDPRKLGRVTLRSDLNQFNWFKWRRGWDSNSRKNALSHVIRCYKIAVSKALTGLRRIIKLAAVKDTPKSHRATQQTKHKCSGSVRSGLLKCTTRSEYNRF